MQVTAYKTPKIRVGENLNTLLDTYLPSLRERDIVVITSKIVSLCQARVVKNDGTIDKHDLIRKEADLYVDEDCLPGIVLTITDNILIPSAGIDESNGDGYFVLWPKDIQETVNTIWQYLKKTHNVKQLGVIITDSHTAGPLRWGTIGFGLAYCGFNAIKNYVGSPDVFGRILRVTRVSHLDGLAAAAVVAMGDGNEQTPLARIREVPFITFTDQPPTKTELARMRIDKKEDLYGPLLAYPKWKKGQKKASI